MWPSVITEHVLDRIWTVVSLAGSITRCCNFDLSSLAFQNMEQTTNIAKVTCKFNLPSSFRYWVLSHEPCWVLEPTLVNGGSVTGLLPHLIYKNGN